MKWRPMAAPLLCSEQPRLDERPGYAMRSLPELRCIVHAQDVALGWEPCQVSQALIKGIPVPAKIAWESHLSRDGSKQLLVGLDGCTMHFKHRKTAPSECSFESYVLSW